MTSSHTKPRRRRLWPWSRRERDQQAAAPAAPALPRLPEGTVLAARGLRLHPAGEGADTGAAGGLDLDVMRGTVTALIGTAGSDAPALLRVLAGLEPAAGGTVLLKGEDVVTPAPDDAERPNPRRARVGLVFEDPGLAPALTVRQNILLAASIAGVPVTRERLESVIAAAGLGDVLDLGPSELSAGLRRRVAVARALVAAPVVLLADEPAGGLEAAPAEEILALLRTAASDLGCAIVIATRDPAVAARADRAVILSGGRALGTLMSPSVGDVLTVLASRDDSPAGGAQSPAEGEGGGAPQRTWQIPQPARRAPEPPPGAASRSSRIPRLPVAGGGDGAPGAAPVAAPGIRLPEEDPRTQEIALLAVEQVRAIDQAAARSAAAHDALREELGAEAVQASLNRLSPTKTLPEDSARVVDQAQRILGDLPGPIMPQD
ncbi:MAG: ATP-binding cassette domain-containing protein [Actinomyces sp.]|nr:ATP-binding cassette domain-containing protein [Actinomyces sp.]MCI1641492.1 ATP-binding cassette domain-containing protein [Actinomyces sp.]MCI1661764.1 ATP-binding cassette domain-containing protein [Actinomyces sp.]MCI1690512.1 ATP-binding cassette domain-containing protein [Actinomyces sp.]MCI1786493.1 ATP-binding cassette domain-containing protein [Actinomyces sp.]MCI1829986.1 ATP-binding cassette domain-containing protein [Actinomyces sp.]